MHRLLWLLLPVLALPVAGILYQRLGALRDKRRFLKLGTLVDIGMRQRMYLSQRGTAGPTVIFESGIAATSQNWMRLQESVSSFARTVTYDRSGLGWSSESVSERIPSNIVRELRLMLDRAAIPPPYVLIGHSFGGLVVRHFASEHPGEVAGVVLIDPMRTEEWPPVNTTQSPLLERGLWLTGMAVPIARFGLARLAITSLLCRSGRASSFFSRIAGAGGQHVLDRVTCELDKMPREVWPIVAAHWSTPKFYRGLAAHIRAVPACVREMHNAAPIEGIPVLLLTPATAEPLSPDALRCIGSTTRQIIVEESGHWVHLDQPELVLEAVRRVVEETRATVLEEVEMA